MNLNLMSQNSPTGEGYSRYILIAAGIVALVILFALYYQTIGYYIQIGWNKLKWSRDHGETVKMDIPGTEISGELTPSSIPTASSAVQKIESDVETALSMGGHAEVFNVSRNIYSFADAEPLCKAFGAELATYDQVKDAYEKGADWCNYGWVKGQTAVYPTQKETWNKLQAGPEDQRGSCGVPGLNGGYFDNPEMRFGVNCFGPKPEQSQHDATDAATGIPMSPEALEVNRKVAEFRTEAPSLGIMPFNHEKWST